MIKIYLNLKMLCSKVLQVWLYYLIFHMLKKLQVYVISLHVQQKPLRTDKISSILSKKKQIIVLIQMTNIVVKYTKIVIHMLIQNLMILAVVFVHHLMKEVAVKNAQLDLKLKKVLETHKKIIIINA